MDKLKEYWDKEIADWENLTYARDIGRLNIYKRIAIYFKRPLIYRMNMSLKILEPYLRDKVVLELGCGSGKFSHELLKYGAKKVIGIDISEEAILRAKDNAIRPDIMGNKYVYICADACEVSFPPFDIIIGLGFLDWIGIKAVEKLFEKIKNKFFLFTFSDKNYSVWELLHRLYWFCRAKLLLQGVYPHHYHLKRLEQILVLKEFKNILFVKDKNLSFGVILHNLCGCVKKE